MTRDDVLDRSLFLNLPERRPGVVSGAVPTGNPLACAEGWPWRDELLVAGADGSLSRPIHFLNNAVSVLFPIANAAKLTRFVARLDEFVGGARRAPSTPSVKNQIDVLGDVSHSGIQITHGNMNGSRNGPIPFQFMVLTHVDQ